MDCRIMTSSSARKNGSDAGRCDHVRRGRRTTQARHQRGSSTSCRKRRSKMLYTIAVILIVLWLLGFVTSYTMGGFIHVLLVIAVVMILIQIIQGRRL